MQIIDRRNKSSHYSIFTKNKKCIKFIYTYKIYFYKLFIDQITPHTILYLLKINNILNLCTIKSKIKYIFVNHCYTKRNNYNGRTTAHYLQLFPFLHYFFSYSHYLYLQEKSSKHPATPQGLGRILHLSSVSKIVSNIPDDNAFLKRDHRDRLRSMARGVLRPMLH